MNHRKPPTRLSTATLINIATILIGIGVNYGIVKNESADVQRRLTELDSLRLSDVKYQTLRNSDTIDKLTTDQKNTTAVVAVIQAKIDVMAVQIAYIADALRTRAVLNEVK